VRFYRETKNIERSPRTGEFSCFEEIEIGDLFYFVFSYFLRKKGAKKSQDFSRGDGCWIGLTRVGNPRNRWPLASVVGAVAATLAKLERHLQTCSHEH